MHATSKLYLFVTSVNESSPKIVQRSRIQNSLSFHCIMSHFIRIQSNSIRLTIEAAGNSESLKKLLYLYFYVYM